MEKEIMFKEAVKQIAMVKRGLSSFNESFYYLIGLQKGLLYGKENMNQEEKERVEEVKKNFVEVFAGYRENKQNAEKYFKEDEPFS